MSGTATFWAWEQYQVKGSAKIVLVCLCDHLNDKTGQCNPSITRIALRTGINKNTVPGTLKKLVALGLISYTQRNGISTQYTINIDADPTTKLVGHRTDYPTLKLVGTLPENRGGPYQESGTKPKREPKS